MTVSWRSWVNLCHICSLLCATGVMSGRFQLEPLNSTVLQGSDAQFNATVPGQYQGMTWHVGGLLVLIVSVDTNFTPSTDQFSAAFCYSTNRSCVQFTIHNVTRGQSGPVVCTVLGDYGDMTAQLDVQESGTVGIVEGNVTVTQDDQVEFQCVTTAWYPAPTVTWIQNGEAMNSSLHNSTNTTNGDSFNSTSTLKFQAVRNTTVECLATIPALTSPQSSSVFMVVVPRPPDWTVLIAVVVSFGGFALLVLLIIGIIFCYKRRKEKKPNYQDEMNRRVRTQSQLSGVSAAGQGDGQVNQAYVTDGQTSLAPSEHTDSGFFQANGSHMFKMPDVVMINHAGNGVDTVDEFGIKKHRHATTV